MDASYLAYCRTEAQKEHLQAYLKYGSTRSAERETGKNRRTIQRSLEAIRQNATLKGLDPEAGLTHPLPDPLRLKGVSSYYNRDGELTGQWVKSTVDEERRLKLIEEWIDRL